MNMINEIVNVWVSLCLWLTPFVTARNADTAIEVSGLLFTIGAFFAGSATALWIWDRIPFGLRHDVTKPNSGFTLIELLVVMAIIAILAMLTLNVAGYIQKKGAASRAEAEMAALSAALESYKADNGDYPEFSIVAGSGSSSDSSGLVGALMPGSGKVYFEFSKGMIQVTGGKTNVVDPFGEVYGYTYPGDDERNGKNFFDLWSRSGSKNTNQWIKNW